MQADWKTAKTSAQRGYGYRWQKARLVFLQENPLCEMCRQAGVVAGAQVVDHKIPHRGDLELFWDRSNWQSLCTSHHSSDKQMAEKSGRKRIIVTQAGEVIWPVR